MKRIVLALAATFALVAGTANAASVNFMVNEHDVAYHATGDVIMKLYSADWMQEATLLFVRGELPADRADYDAATGMVTLYYPIDELHAMRRVLLESTTISFVYHDNYMGTGEEVGYVYTIPALQ